jgi:hypothetical protein
MLHYVLYSCAWSLSSTVLIITQSTQSEAVWSTPLQHVATLNVMLEVSCRWKVNSRVVGQAKVRCDDSASCYTDHVSIGPQHTPPASLSSGRSHISTSHILIVLLRCNTYLNSFTAGALDTQTACTWLAPTHHAARQV